MYISSYTSCIHLHVHVHVHAYYQKIPIPLFFWEFWPIWTFKKKFLLTKKQQKCVYIVIWYNNYFLRKVWPLIQCFFFVFLRRTLLFIIISIGAMGTCIWACSHLNSNFQAFQIFYYHSIFNNYYCRHLHNSTVLLMTEDIPVHLHLFIISNIYNVFYYHSTYDEMHR